MKKIFIIILIILLIILAVACYYVYNVRKLANLVENNNKTYENYYEQEILGTTLISILNKATDQNERNAVEKQENTIYYENNNEDSIQITIKFIELENTVKMEDISENKIENFLEHFSAAKFKCTKIEYHEKTNYIKSLHFEQVNNL